MRNWILPQEVKPQMNKAKGEGEGAACLSSLGCFPTRQGRSSFQPIKLIEKLPWAEKEQAQAMGAGVGVVLWGSSAQLGFPQIALRCLKTAQPFALGLLLATWWWRGKGAFIVNETKTQRPRASQGPIRGGVGYSYPGRQLYLQCLFPIFCSYVPQGRHNPKHTQFSKEHRSMAVRGLWAKWHFATEATLRLLGQTVLSTITSQCSSPVLTTPAPWGFCGPPEETINSRIKD